MKPNAEKNRKLLKRYPFLTGIINVDMEPFGTPFRNTVHDLTIRFEKADGDLMFRRADNVGLADKSCIFSTRENRKGQVMRRGEYLFAVDDQNQFINRLSWPRNDEERQETGAVYGYAVLWGTRHSKEHYSNSNSDQVKYLVWVTVEAWHQDTRNDDIPGGRFGELCDRSLYITVYGAPKCGFAELQHRASLAENLYLENRIFLDAVFEHNREITVIGGRLDELCRLFQDEVFFNGMKDAFDKGRCRGASGHFGPVKVLCAEMCDYNRIQLEDATSWISLQLRPEGKGLYVLGMGGTLPQLRHLIKTVVKLWNEKPELRAAFQPDENVSVM